METATAQITPQQEWFGFTPAEHEAIDKKLDEIFAYEFNDFCLAVDIDLDALWEKWGAEQ